MILSKAPILHDPDNFEFTGLNKTLIQFKVPDMIVECVSFISHSSQLFIGASVLFGITFGSASFFASDQNALSCAAAFDGFDDRFY